jgi:hypothetical protein
LKNDGGLIVTTARLGVKKEVSGLWFLVSVLGGGEKMATLKQFEDIEA